MINHIDEEIIMDHTEAFPSKILNHGEVNVQVVTPFSPSWMKVRIIDYPTQFSDTLKDIKNFYSQRDNEMRVNFDIDMTYLGLPIIFKKDNVFQRGVITYFNLYHENMVLIYNVDEDEHHYIREENIFYIIRKFLKVPKNLLIIGLSDICPVQGQTWSKNIIDKFKILFRNKLIVFYVKKVIDDIHLGWGKLNRLWSVDDFLEKENLAKLDYGMHSIYLNYNEVINADGDDDDMNNAIVAQRA